RSKRMLAHEIERDGQSNRSRDTKNGQIPRDHGRLFACPHHFGAPKRDQGMARDVEVIRTFEVAIEFSYASHDRLRLHRHIDLALSLPFGSEKERTLDVENPARLPRHSEMIPRKRDIRMLPVEHERLGLGEHK